jgi:hypothetical protein
VPPELPHCRGTGDHVHGCARRHTQTVGEALLLTAKLHERRGDMDAASATLDGSDVLTSASWLGMSEHLWSARVELESGSRATLKAVESTWSAMEAAGVGHDSMCRTRFDVRIVEKLIVEGVKER